MRFVEENNKHVACFERVLENNEYLGDFQQLTTILLPVFDWVEANMPESKIIKFRQSWKIEFNSRDDALLFKLIWGGHDRWQNKRV